MSNKNWWEEAGQPAPVRSDSHEWIYQWAQQALSVRAMELGVAAPLRVGAAGPVLHANVYMDLVALLQEVGAKLAEESFYVWDDDFEEVYVWPEGAAFVTSADESAQLGVNIVTTNYAFAETVREFAFTNLLRRTKTNRGRVYVLTATESGVRPTPLGFAAVPLEVNNYDPSIQEALAKAVSDLATPFPDGRLTILEGPPGCGKTFLIRSLVHEVPTAKFIFVPPAMVPNLGDPSLVTALISLKDEASSDEDEMPGPTVLICEDADSILTTRGSDNMSATSSLLNLTSGLLGDIIDVRVIATTNAPKSQIEAALMRNGRLAQYLQVPPVTGQHATEILRRLLDQPEATADWPAARVPVYKTNQTTGFASSGETVIKDKVLLADVFKVAKSKGWKPKKIKAKVDAAKIISRRPRRYGEGATAPKSVLPLTMVEVTKRETEKPESTLDKGVPAVATEILTPRTVERA